MFTCSIDILSRKRNVTMVRHKIFGVSGNRFWRMLIFSSVKIKREHNTRERKKKPRFKTYHMAAVVSKLKIARGARRHAKKGGYI